MSTFIHEDWLLQNKSAQILYHDYAKKMPIHDFHNHLTPAEIASNRQFNNMTEIWLGGDHYKWRAMRWLGIEERFITGDASDEDKFMMWAKCVPYTVGNPLYHWTHLELARYFGIHELLSEDTARGIWEKCNEKLQDPSMSTNGILKQFDVRVACTTDAPTDSLEHHQQIAKNPDIDTVVVPSFRPDRALDVVHATFKDYVQELSGSTKSGQTITTYTQFIEALGERVGYFHEQGGRVSDHGFETLPYVPANEQEVSFIFSRALNGETLSQEEIHKHQSFTMLHLAGFYHQYGWVMQLHIGAIRNNNERMFKLLGRDTGYDSILDYDLARSLNAFLNQLEQFNQLPKTIIYTLNPTQYEMIASAIGNFQAAGIRGKVQMGSGWWFHDQKDGMIRQLTALSSIGLMSTFVGMLTDSRSFLSFTRHEYFRRILCNLMGTWIEEGELPSDFTFIGGIIEDICYNNAKQYFDIRGLSV
ncbi:glucuronate isomerase [Paenibacillus selenitireducens]|uniref:Uronate isomerase n=1 Tax=Paenibacillus selenitireducens TaxID=1324314 RepID=A0A1T2X6T9_9BACL|nr:glucuronate isomerase [Paenibacillus selenitireducens]OPA75598.1 glucuronate isomerase [Paenibacillus selenitireducens]